jgi:hypothetical protein
LCSPCMFCDTTVSLFEHPRPVLRAASCTQYLSALLHADLSRVLKQKGSAQIPHLLLGTSCEGNQMRISRNKDGQVSLRKSLIYLI